MHMTSTIERKKTNRNNNEEKFFKAEYEDSPICMFWFTGENSLKCEVTRLHTHGVGIGLVFFIGWVGGLEVVDFFFQRKWCVGMIALLWAGYALQSNDSYEYWFKEVLYIHSYSSTILKMSKNLVKTSHCDSSLFVMAAYCWLIVVF